MCSNNSCMYMHIVYIPLYFFDRAFFTCRERACAGRWGVGLVWWAGAAVLPLLLWFFFPFPLCFLVVLYLFSLVACCALFLFFS